MQLALAAVLAAPTAAVQAQARPLTIANFGGANGKAQEAAFHEPFARTTGRQVVAVEYNGGLDQVKAMVRSGKVDWDVVEVESADLAPGCEAGLFERIKRESIATAGIMLPGAVHDCGIGAFVWSTVLAYDTTRLKDAPRSWADVWDVVRFPGKRGLRKGARYNLEIALMADGVPRDAVYRVLGTDEGVARALRKLEELKPHVVWWDAGSRPVSMLAGGEVVMSTAFNGRIAAANRDGAKLAIVWRDAIYELEYWAVVKGSPQRDLALKYISFATSEQPQLEFSKAISYGPTNFNAILKYDSGTRNPSADPRLALIDLSMVTSDLPSTPANLRRSLAFNPAYWTERGAAIEARFNKIFR